MKTIAHLSDLHFGRIDQTVSDALAAEIRSADPDIVVVSGDLTQRAHKQEFVHARAFLDALPYPQLIVPGNHDVPLFNLFARAVTPLSRYKRYITADTDPFYVDPELAIAGINTARSFTFKGGRINGEQLAWVKQNFADQPDETTRIVVTHHPFEGASAHDDDGIVGRARLAMGVFSESRVDVILSGHLHLNRMGSSAARYKIEGYSALLIQAGTAMSLRRREEANSFNLIRIERPEIHLECRSWMPGEARFVRSTSKSFHLGPSGWAPTGGTTIPTLVQTADNGIVRADDGIR